MLPTPVKYACVFVYKRKLLHSLHIVLSTRGHFFLYKLFRISENGEGKIVFKICTQTGRVGLVFSDHIPAFSSLTVRWRWRRIDTRHRANPFSARDDHPPKGRQFARSNGHWRRSRRRGWGTTYTIIMTEAIWRCYNRIRYK